jgi:hypothetical protein
MPSSERSLLSSVLVIIFVIYVLVRHGGELKWLFSNDDFGSFQKIQTELQVK